MTFKEVKRRNKYGIERRGLYMNIIVLLIIGIGIYFLVSGNARAGDVGKFWLGILAKGFCSVIAIGLCMAILIPVVNVILAIYFVLQIWKSPVDL